MGTAFDRACSSLARLARNDHGRELIAKSIIEAAMMGEHDPVRLHSRVLMRFHMDNLRMQVSSGPRNLPVAPMARTH
jgi:hypothetical protein